MQQETVEFRASDASTPPQPLEDHEGVAWIPTDVGFRVSTCNGHCSGCEAVVTIGSCRG